MSTPTFIYALCEPGTRTVRYIGKADAPKNRLAQHLSTSTKQRCHLGHWLLSLVSRGETPVLVVLHEVSKNECWQEEERRYISCARALGMNLVNSTDGGEGISGHVFTLEQRATISAALRGVPKSPKHRAALSRAWTPEGRAAKSAAQKGVPLSPDWCESISASWTPERRSALSAAKTGVPHSPEHCAALCGPKSPEHRAVLKARCAINSASQRGVPSPPEHCAARRVPKPTRSPEHCAALSRCQKGFCRGNFQSLRKLPAFSDGGGI